MLEVFQRTKRLQTKTDEHTLIHLMNSRYDLSPAEAECLAREIHEHFNNTTYLADGQQFYTAIDINEPPGKPLTECKTKRVKLTVRAPGDCEFQKEKGLWPLIQMIISRICWEAYEQGALLTQEDAAQILLISVPSVKRIMRKYRKASDFIPTRGNFHDIGPGVTHKSEAVRLYIKGVTPTDIGYRMGHSLNAIERYISDFSLVVAAHLQGYFPLAISRFTEISERVVNEYLILYDRYCHDPQLKPLLADLIGSWEHLQPIKKTEGENNESEPS